MRCPTTPGRGGARAHPGIALGLTARGGDYPGYRDTPGHPRWGHTPGSATPGAARGEGTSGFFWGKTEPKQEKSLTQQAKVSQKRPKIIKTDKIYFRPDLGINAALRLPVVTGTPRAAPPPPRPEGPATPGRAALRTTRPHLGTTRRCPRCARAPPSLGSLGVAHNSETPRAVAWLLWPRAPAVTCDGGSSERPRAFQNPL